MIVWKRETETNIGLYPERISSQHDDDVEFAKHTEEKKW